MRPDEALLLDMLQAAQEAATIASSLTEPEFQNSRLHQLAILKAVEIIGEAASRVSDATTADHPDIPWVEIIGMRNRIVHGYASIRLEVVWRTVREDIPALLEQLRPLVPKDED